MATRFNKTTGKYETDTGGLGDDGLTIEETIAAALKKEKEGEAGSGGGGGGTAAANINAQTAKTTASAKSKAAALKVKNDKAAVDAKNLYTRQQNALAVAQQQKTNKQQYDATIAAGKTSAAEGVAQNKAYQTQGNDVYDKLLAIFNPQYDKQVTDATSMVKSGVDTGNATIETAKQALLKGLLNANSYSNVPLANLQPQQQGLTNALNAYGASSGDAMAQQGTDTALNQFLYNLQNAGNTQLNAANANYNVAQQNRASGAAADYTQRNASAGSQLLNDLLGQISTNRGTSTVNAENQRQGYVQRGIDAQQMGVDTQNKYNTQASLIPLTDEPTPKTSKPKTNVLQDMKNTGLTPAQFKKLAKLLKTNQSMAAMGGVAK